MNTHLAMADLERLRLIVSSLTDDEDTIRDTIEGEFDTVSLVRNLLNSADDDRALVDGLKARIAELTERCKRLTLRADNKEVAIERVMQLANLRRLEMDVATVSFTTARPSVVITNGTEIPEELCRVTTTPDKAKIVALLKAGETVPGAELAGGHSVLSIRRK